METYLYQEFAGKTVFIEKKAPNLRLQMLIPFLYTVYICNSLYRARIAQCVNLQNRGRKKTRP